MTKKISAGLLMFRTKGQEMEVFLVHPGGPFYRNKDEGVWSIPKGEPNENSADLFAEAQREFEEETGIAPDAEVFYPLGSVVQKGGKTVHAWAFEKSWDGEITSNQFEMEWPPKSGKIAKFPEADRGAYFSLGDAKKRINPAQQDFLERLTEKLGAV